jgi:hypothetical protein
MSGPKHLWSGDWQNQSAAASDELADRPVKPAAPKPPAPPATRPAPASRPAPAPRPARARRRPSMPSRPALSRPLLIALSALLVIGAAYGVTRLFGGSGSLTPTTGAGGLVASGSSRPITWLGMEIQTVPPGVAVIETVKLGSQGDRAGLEPGDVILQVNNRPIDGTGDIAGAIRGLHSGDRVALQVSQGSALSETEATLTAPPSAYP